MKRSANKYRTPKAQENIRELEKQLSFKERLFSILAFKRGINRLSKWTLIVVLSLAAIVGLTYTVRCIFDSAYGSEIQNVNYTSKHNILSKQQVMLMLGISDDTDLDSLPIDELISKLNNHPAINHAQITKEGTDSLHVSIEEHAPIAFVEMADSAITGKTTRLYVNPEGELFSIDPKLHLRFNNLPVWLLNVGDVKQFIPGEKLNKELYEPILELIIASNAYELAELPAISTIECPDRYTHQWRIILHLENGTVVSMNKFAGIREQLYRLVKIISHARSNGKHLKNVEVAPSEYPSFRYAD